MSESSGGPDRKTILVVDDTPDNLAVLGELLMPHFQVRVANSGARALAAAASPPRPDLILLDIMMQGMDGFEVIERLKSDPLTAAIPVIFITALDRDEDETRGLQLGAVDYITKPIRPSIVLARVRGQLEVEAARTILRDKNAWLESEVQRRVQQYQKVQDVSMRALASLAEARDKETGNHILRTRGYVNVLARDLAGHPQYADVLTPDAIEVFTKAATLHDIGKVGIPDGILHKPGKLDPEEWEVMKTHAQIGAEAIWRAVQDEKDLEAVDFLYVAMEMAGSHHERWDGTGYPRGLVGEAIPVSARLMALADVFDSRVNRRVYKPPFPFDKAQELINAESGSHFDPAVVAAFNRNMDEFRAIALRYVDPEHTDAV